LKEVDLMVVHADVADIVGNNHKQFSFSDSLCCIPALILHGNRTECKTNLQEAEKPGGRSLSKYFP
ncbi:MAG: hypothetical protein II405_05065, partial [Oscillospiraceae bacterium]|nr:hypothetical protein [Oscillospiraceae bacterium]